ncbi:MAG: outer membrane protein assembly factor BamD [Gemmatimonadota bacterium]
MMRWSGRVVLLGTVLGTGCLFGRGAPKPAPPAETVESTSRRTDSLMVVGEAHFRSGDWSKTIEVLNRALLLLDYSDPRRAQGYFMLGEAKLANGLQLEAVREFRRVADEGVVDSLAPAALVRAGDAYAALWRRPELDPSYGESAMATYQEVSQRFPGTGAAVRAQQRVLGLHEKFAEKELRSARFYLKFKATESAILTLRSLIATYPRTRSVPPALASLVEAYRKLGYVEDLRETCGYIDRFFPAVVPDVAYACPARAVTDTL